jgi:hypothetical protein
MKKYIFILIALFSFKAGITQDTMRASISVAGNPSNIKIWLLPLATKTPCVFSTLQFNIAIPSSIVPIPTLSVISSAFAGVSWIVELPYTEGGYTNYNVYTNNAGYTLNTVAGVEFQAMELSFSGGPGGGAVTFANTANLVTHPDGGVGGTGNGFGLFYCTGSLFSNGKQLYYNRGGVTVSNGDSYTSRISGVERPQGTFTSFARLIPPIALPVKFASFFVYKQSHDGLLNWNIENQSGNVKNYEVERSFDGVNFTKISTQNPLNPTNGFVSYNFTDAGVFDSYKGTVYYRIKQIDLTGEITYSPIRNIRSDSKAFGLNIYPNPVKDKANLVFTLEKAEAVSITLLDALGKRITDYSVQAQKGINQKQIDMSSIAAGTYSFRITTKNDIQNLSFVKSN